MHQQTFSTSEFAALERSTPVNVAKVPQRSPFRYPGGKTWLVPQIRKWLLSKPIRQRLLVEPFAGGGIVSLTAAFEGLAEKVLMVEMDQNVAAVWKTIVEEDADALANRILNFKMSREAASEIIQSEPSTMVDRAFRTIVMNRTLHGGIMAEGSGLIKFGENGRGVLSRWYAETVAARIRDIASIRDRIQIVTGDAFDILRNLGNEEQTSWFIDPPYTAGGKSAGSRLYSHWKVDHAMLFDLAGRLGGDFLMTYDNAAEVERLAALHGFTTAAIAMKNTHHAELTELLVGRDLGWL